MEPSSAEKMVWAPVYLETILVPTDLRPDSKVALSFALALAQKFDANLVLLHVFAEPYSSDTEIGAGAGRLMASHCYGWFDRLIHGSDAEAVLRQAPCPVLIAKDV